jgi:hypothetical protein
LTVSPTTNRAAVGFFLAGDHAEQRGLPAPFGPMTPTMPPGGRRKVQVVDQHLVAVALGSALASMTSSPRRGPGGDDDLRVRCATSFDSASSAS